MFMEGFMALIMWRFLSRPFLLCLFAEQCSSFVQLSYAGMFLTIINCRFMKIYQITISVAGLLLASLSPAHAANNLFESDWATGNIYKFTPAGVRSTFASGLSSPEGLAFDQAGNLYVGNAGASEIIKIKPDGTKSVFASGLLNPYGLAINSAGDLFMSHYGGGITKFTPTGVSSVYASGSSTCPGLAFDTYGTLFASEFNGNKITELTPDGLMNTFSSAVSQPFGLAFEGLILPVPEPSVLCLVAAGLTGFIVWC